MRNWIGYLAIMNGEECTQMFKSTVVNSGSRIIINSSLMLKPPIQAEAGEGVNFTWKNSGYAMLGVRGL